MAYVSLYRKWRPQTLDEIAGQPHVTQTLKNAILAGRVSHAYLFCGPRGTGKTTTARILAKAINCVHGPTPVPCNECDPCRSVNEGSSMDVLELDAASNRKVDEIREFLERIPYSSTAGGKKVYIIDEVHMLTTESFNTLLKTLEEPPEHVVFVLATTEPHKVLPTILSRCQRFDFRRIPVPDIEARLSEVAGAEGIEIGEGALALLSHHAQGSLRDALGALEQLASYSTEAIHTADVVSLLGLTDTELLASFTDALAAGNLADGLLFIDDLAAKGFDLRQFIQDLLGYLRNLFLAQTVPLRRPSGIPDELFDRFSEQAAAVNPRSLLFFISALNDVYNQSRWATDIRLLLEIALFKMVRTGDDVSLEGLMHRIERLESALAGGQVAGAHPPAPQAATPAPAAAPEPSPVPGAAKPAARRPQPSPAAPAPAAASTGGIDLQAVQVFWPQALKIIKEKKKSRFHFFAAAKLSRIEDGKLVILVKESDKQFVETPENMELLRGALKVASGFDIPIICELETGREREPARSPRSAAPAAGNGGAAPRTVAVADAPVEEEPLSPDDYIKLVQDTFGAKIVEEIAIEDTTQQEDI